jgi:hypothetical protein
LERSRIFVSLLWLLLWSSDIWYRGLRTLRKEETRQNARLKSTVRQP